LTRNFSKKFLLSPSIIRAHSDSEDTPSLQALLHSLHAVAHAAVRKMRDRDRPSGLQVSIPFLLSSVCAVLKRTTPLLFLSNGAPKEHHFFLDFIFVSPDCQFQFGIPPPPHWQAIFIITELRGHKGTFYHHLPAVSVGMLPAPVIFIDHRAALQVYRSFPRTTHHTGDILLIAGYSEHHLSPGKNSPVTFTARKRPFAQCGIDHYFRRHHVTALNRGTTHKKHRHNQTDFPHHGRPH